MKDKDIKRFESKYIPDPNSGCWLWLAAVSTKGYGKFHYKDKWVSAHRFSYELHKKKIDNGNMVMHSCDIPSCVNPNHLSEGTNQDNMDDAKMKGRFKKGSEKPQSKLSEENIPYIRNQKGKRTCTDLANEFGVDHSRIVNIWNNKEWRHG